MTRRKSTRAKAAPDVTDSESIILIDADAILAALPVPMTLQQLLAFERTKKFVPAFRLVSQKSNPLWPLEPVITWIRDTYAAFPKAVEKAERRLRSHPGAQITAHHRSKPRAVVYRVPDGLPHEDSRANCTDLVRTGAYRWEPRA